MIDPLAETLLTMKEARRAFPPNLQPSTATLWRWVLRGCRGVVLESIKIGGRRYTTEAAISRFIEGCTESGKKRTLSGKTTRSDEAKTILDHYGI